MTISEIAELAVARALEFGAREPISREPVFRRIGYRQQRLFSRANKENPDYFGTCAVVTLSGGRADLDDVPLADGDGDPLYDPEQVEQILVEDEGASEDLAAGDVVRLVPFDDTGVTDPPRMTLRDNLLEQVGTDLAGVVSVKVHYSRVPHAVVPATDANVSAQLPEAWQDLLVVDATKFILRSAPNEVLMRHLDSEEAEMLEDFLAHVRRQKAGETGRFAVRSREAAA